jgi:hypothetical protein
MFRKELYDFDIAFERRFVERCPACIALNVDKGSPFNKVSYFVYFSSGSSSM